jgi:hypothetical protein
MTFVVEAQAKRPPVSAFTFFNRQPLYLRPDPSWVVVRPFRLASEPRDLNPTDWNRADHIVGRVLAMDAETTASLLDDVLLNFEGRHRNLLAKFEARAAEMENALTSHPDLTRYQRQLVGAYFMHEYSFEASALFNPSIVPHPDRTGAPAGGCRFVLSVRAVGEGHISSLTFRAGSIASDGSVTIDPTTRLAAVPQVVNRVAGPDGDIVHVHFKDEDDISERVIFPITLAQANGIEDARFLAFEDEGRRIYYATYTAYSGGAIRSELIETTDFRSFRMTPLRGAAAGNQGMGLFPRKIDGRYAMIGRQDNENLYLIYSNNLLFWDGGIPILKPKFPWEFVQIGTCGAPIELNEGWLLLIHGVGPVRKYAIGAVLLDLSDPSKVLGRPQSRSLDPSRPNVKGMCPTSSTPVERCVRVPGSSCLMPCPTHFRPLGQSRSSRF